VWLRNGNKQHGYANTFRWNHTTDWQEQYDIRAYSILAPDWYDLGPKMAAALAPFAIAAQYVPESVEDFKIIASVPGGTYALSFQKMATTLTAGNLRRARDAVLAMLGGKT
jgi:hypothetical protein